MRIRDSLPDGWSIIGDDEGWLVLDEDGETVCAASNVQKVVELLNVEHALAQTYVAWQLAVQNPEPAEA